MAAPATDNIRVAIRVRPLIKRESDLHSNINWKVNRNTITQVSNGKLLPNSSYSFDRIFDTSNSTQDVYNEFGKPIVLSAMDGFNGTLFAYGQTSSGKTHTMMGDQQSVGVIPKAIREMYLYIEKHPTREFLIRVSYMEIYNEDIRDLLNPTKTNLKIHENVQKQVYVGELSEEVVSCSEDVFKHMLRGEKNRHFGETNMNDRSSRSHTIFRVVIESREMIDESKDRDSADGAVRVAHLNLVDLAGSERASQTGAFGQRLKEGGHINKSLLVLGTVIAKLSEGESFIPFRDSKLTRILQSSLGGNAKTSIVCTVTPAAVEETIGTLKFASRAKTIKNCPEVNEVLDDGTLLKRCRKEISELKKQLTQMGNQSTNMHLQELQVEKEKMAELLEQQRKQQSDQEEKIKKLCDMICSSGRENEPRVAKVKMAKRRETWCPGPALSKNPLASAAALANQVQSRLARISSSPSSEESEFDEMSKETFLTMLDDKEEKKGSSWQGRKKVGFVSPQAKRCLSPIIDEEQEDKEMQTEPDERFVELQQEVKTLRKDLNEAIQTRDLFNGLLEESNALLEKMSIDGGHGSSSTVQASEVTVKYVSELRSEKAGLEEQVSILQTQCKDFEKLKEKNKELEDQVQSMENEMTVANEYLTELQTEYNCIQAQNQALTTRVEGLENTSTFNASVKAELDSLHVVLGDSSREKEQLVADVEFWKEKHAALEQEMARLQRESTPVQETFELQQSTDCVDEEATKVKELEMEVKRLEEKLQNEKELEEKLSEVVEQKTKLEDILEQLKGEVEQEVKRKEEVMEQKCEIEATFERFREEKDGVTAQLLEDVDKLQNQLKEAQNGLDANEAELAEILEQKRELESNFELLKTGKESELIKFKEEQEQLKNELNENMSVPEEKEIMLAEVIQQKCEVEEKFDLFKQEKEIEIAKLTQEMQHLRDISTEHSCGEEEKESTLMEEIQQKSELEERIAVMKQENELEIVKLTVEIDLLRKENEERSCGLAEKENALNEVIHQKCALKEEFEVFKHEKENEIVKLAEEYEELRSQHEASSCVVEENQDMLDKVIQQKCELKEKFEIFKQEKEVEIAKLAEEIHLVQVKSQESSSSVEENEGKIAELTQEKCEVQEKFELFRQEKEMETNELLEKIEAIETGSDVNRSRDAEDELLVGLKAKMSNLEVELERKMGENQELEKTLDRVKKERDEIKNDLSETITDTAELQKDVFDMQQKVKRYKEHIRELEEERQERADTGATHQEKIEDLTMQLSLARQELEQVSVGNDNGLVEKTTVNQEESGQRENANLASLLETEKARVQEITEECNTFKSTVEKHQESVVILENEVNKRQQEIEELRETISELEEQLVESEQAGVASEKLVQEAKEKNDALVKALEEYKSDVSRAVHVQGDLSNEVELQKIKKESEELTKELAEEKKAHEALRKEHCSLSDEFQQMRNSKVQDRNHGMNQQRVIDKMKAERRETICNQAQQRQGLEKDLLEAEKKVLELESKCTHLQSEKDLLDHRLEVANKKVDETKQEMRDMENLYSLHDTRTVTHVDDSKAVQKLKQVEFNMDLTKQKFEKAERRLKELESENRQLKGADIRNGSLTEERDNLKNQLQQAKQVLNEKGRKLNDMSIEVTQLKAHVDKLSDENKKHRSALEKKDAKIDNLEQKLWETGQQLSAERENFKEQQAQSSAMEELNSTIRVKHEELEHMTFLVDEREVEISEVRSSLEQNERIQEEMRETILQREQRISEVETELADISKQLLETTAKQHEAEGKIVELEEIVQQQKEEIMQITEQATNENTVEQQDLNNRIEKLEGDLQDREHKLLEVELELEFTKKSFEEACSVKEDLLGLLGAYGKALAEEGSDEDIVFDVEHLNAKLEGHMERISQLKETAKRVEDFVDRVEALNEEKRLLDVKNVELQSSLESQMTSLEEEVEEIRASLLDEKKLVFQLESKLSSEVKRKDAMETELRRVLAEKETGRKPDFESELRQELEKEKVTNEKLTTNIEKLVQEHDKWKTVAQNNSLALEEENNSLVEELARLKERFEMERDQLHDLNSSNLKEIEMRSVEKENRINDLEAQLMTAGQSTADCQNTLDRYQLKLANTERELETTLARLSELEKQAKDSIISATLGEECQAAKKEAKDNLDLFFRETDRLKAIIDEQQDEQEEYVRQMSELKESAGEKDSEIARLKSEMSRVANGETLKADHAGNSKNIEKDNRIKDLETQLVTAGQRTADYQNTLDHYQLKLANTERELETTLARLSELEKQAKDSNISATLEKECQAAKKEAKENLDLFFRETDRLKAIIDEQQDEQDEFVRQMNELKESTGEKDSEIARLKSEMARLAEGETLKGNNDNAQGAKESEEELKTVRGELVQRNMTIQELQYELYKLRELHEQETRRLAKEVECGREKAGNLKLEIRRLKELDSEDTIRMMRGQPVSSKKKDDGDVGVVSNVAIYSLKAKVGKLEAETDKLNQKLRQLEKDKSTLALLNTEASNRVAQLTADNNVLKAHKKKLVEEVQRFKKTQENAGSADVEKAPRNNTSILGLSVTENIEMPPAEPKKSKPEPKANWLDGATRDVFQDEPNQCANQ